MQVFLGDEVTLVNDGEEGDNPTFVTGQVAGVKLDSHRKVERIYLHHIDTAFWMSDGWKFLEIEVTEDDPESD